MGMGLSSNTRYFRNSFQTSCFSFCILLWFVGKKTDWNLSGPNSRYPDIAPCPFQDSTADSGGIASTLPCFHVLSRKYRRGTLLHRGCRTASAHARERGSRTRPLHIETPETPYCKTWGYHWGSSAEACNVGPLSLKFCVHGTLPWGPTILHNWQEILSTSQNDCQTRAEIFTSRSYENKPEEVQKK